MLNEMTSIGLNDFEFLGEGGAHIVFRLLYSNIVAKSSSALSSALSSASLNLSEVVFKVLKFQNGVTPEYYSLHHDRIVVPWFSKKYVPQCILRPLHSLIKDEEERLRSDFHSRCNTYCEIVESINTIAHALSEEFILELISKCSEARSSSRRSIDIKLSNFVIFEENAFGLAGPLRAISDDSAKSISFEIKVKCGLKLSSPFACGANAVKSSLSRFQIIQMEKHGFITDFSRLYNPCDLCSMQSFRIRQAICALFFIKNKYIKPFVSSKPTEIDEVFREFPRLTTSFTHSESETSVTLSSSAELKINSALAIEIMSQIISAEDACFKLQSMQELDFIDIEGCFLVYKRVLDYLNGDARQIYHLISMKFCEAVYVNKLQKLALFLQSVEHRTDFNTSTDKDCIQHDTLHEKILYLIRSCSCSPTDNSILLDWISNLSIDESIDIIAMWLLSLMAKDASVAVSFTPVFLSSKCNFDEVLTSDQTSSSYNSGDNDDTGFEFVDIGKIFPFPSENLTENTPIERNSIPNYLIKVNNIQPQLEGSHGSINASFVFKDLQLNGSTTMLDCQPTRDSSIKSKNSATILSINLSISYKVQLLDTGPKPLEKILQKFHTEFALCEKISKIMDGNIKI